MHKQGKRDVSRPSGDRHPHLRSSTAHRRRARMGVPLFPAQPVRAESETGRPACGNPASLLRRGCDGRDLLSGMVDGIVAAVGSRQDDLGDRNKCVALLEQLFKNAGQGFRGVEGGVVKEHDGSRLDLGSDPLRDLRRRKVLPVQAVTFPYRFKLLRSNNYFSLG